MKTAQPAVRRRSTPPTSTRPRRSEPVVLAPQVGVALAGAPLRLAGPQASSAAILCPDVAVDAVRQDRHRRLHGHDDARLDDAGDRREVALRGGPGTQPARTPTTHPQEPEDPDRRLRLAPEPPAARTSTTAPRRSSTTGPARSSPTSGSASYTAPRHEEVPAPVRRPVRRLAPARVVDQADQLRHRHRGPDDDRGDDVHGRRRPTSAAGSSRPRPTSSSAARSGCATALQFSLNIPSIKAGLMNGLDHFFQRVQGLRDPLRPGRRCRSSRWAIGTLEIHPIDLLGAYGAIANGGKLMPRTTILKVTGPNGKVVWPDAATRSRQGQARSISPQAAYIITDILAGNTELKTNPFWGEWAVYDGGDPPAGRLQDRDDERQPRRPRLRLPRPAEGPEGARPSRSASGWATATTRRTPTRCRSARRRRSGRGS